MNLNLRIHSLTAAFVAVCTMLTTGCGTSRAGYESAPYQVVSTDEKFEVRNYPAITVVETPMTVGSNSSDGSFGRLFRYISGGNDAKQKIAMTTPVFMSGGETSTTMSFVMPAKMRSGEVPKPSDGAVKVRELQAGCFATLRFSGSRNAKTEGGALAQLRAKMKESGLKESGPPVYAYFDPPWIPVSMRRNEVMLRIEVPAQKTSGS